MFPPIPPVSNGTPSDPLQVFRFMPNLFQTIYQMAKGQQPTQAKPTNSPSPAKPPAPPPPYHPPVTPPPTARIPTPQPPPPRTIPSSQPGTPDVTSDITYGGEVPTPEKPVPVPSQIGTTLDPNTPDVHSTFDPSTGTTLDPGTLYPPDVPMDPNVPVSNGPGGYPTDGGTWYPDPNSSSGWTFDAGSGSSDPFNSINTTDPFSGGNNYGLGWGDWGSWGGGGGDSGSYGPVDELSLNWGDE